jgi:glutathione S-transferase
MLPIFYSFRRCPYAIRARLALRVSETAVDLREVSLKNKPAEMLAASPKATVPVLVLPDGGVIDESLDIMHWALAQHDPAQWLAADSADLIAQNDGMFKHHLDRYKYPNRYVCDASPRLADYALLPFVRQYAQTDRPWFDAQAVPALQHWLDELVASPLFGAVMQPTVPSLQGGVGEGLDTKNAAGRGTID